MPNLTDRRKATQRRALKKQRARVRYLHKLRGAIAKARKNITARRRLIRQGANPGAAAVRAALSMVGKTETGYNDAPWLRAMERDILKAGYQLDWMIPGQPYCGFGVIWAWLKAGKKLPAGTVYTPNICPSDAYGTKVSAYNARPGDLVVFHFGSGGAKHVGLALGPAKGGVIQCVEFNTSPSNAGSQGNGGGVWKRSRPLGLVQCVKRP